MTESRHDEFVSASAAYAIDALDAGERSRFEAHLAGCAECQAEVAAYQRVGVGLGLAIDPMAPPAALKTRVLARATATPAPGVGFGSYGWLAIAASVLVAASALIYSWSLRSQLDSMRQIAELASGRAQALRGELAATRREAAEAGRIAAVLTAPDLVRVTLTGTSAASSASGQGFWSRSRGLVFTADKLPPLRAGRTYQLWVVLPNQSPVSAGLLGVSAGGTGTLVTISPSGVEIPKATVLTLAITDEPTLGSPLPTTPILLAGSAKTN